MIWYSWFLGHSVDTINCCEGSCSIRAELRSLSHLLLSDTDYFWCFYRTWPDWSLKLMEISPFSSPFKDMQPPVFQCCITPVTIFKGSRVSLYRRKSELTATPNINNKCKVKPDLCHHFRGWQNSKFNWRSLIFLSLPVSENTRLMLLILLPTEPTPL